MTVVAIISTNFRDKTFWRRWEVLAERRKDLKVCLIAPKQWIEGSQKQYTLGRIDLYSSADYSNGNFSVFTVDMRQNRFGDWTSRELPSKLRQINPDVMYFIGHHGQLAMAQAVHAASSLPHCRILTFTMRSDITRARPRGKRLKHVVLWKLASLIEHYNVRKSNAIVCHYPDAKEAIIREGFKRPVYINTQIGVDSKLFKYSGEGRDRVRKELNIVDEYVFGSASRFNEEKGIFDILHALVGIPDVKYMMLGGGTSEETSRIKDAIEALGLEDTVIMPGLKDWDVLPDYLSAMDCAIHVPRTTEKWKETFSLALVQAEAVGVPLIGSDSGSVPYQCGFDDLIVCEGNIDELRKKMQWVVSHKEEAKLIGQKQREYVLENFDIEVLAIHFSEIMTELSPAISDNSLGNEYDLGR